MSSWPFRFVHAADLHLELPPFGVAEVPDHLRELFVESAYMAAERVFETTLSEQAEFLVLCGDVVDPKAAGPRALVFLMEQFGRLAEREIPIFWAGGTVDPPDAWPSAVRLPKNVHVFSGARPEEHVHHRDGTPLAQIIGASRRRGRGIRVADFEPDSAGLFSIAAIHGTADPEALKRRKIDYWALGGSHARHTLFTSPRAAHDPGIPQGRQPAESGPHGCTVVHVDSDRHARATLAPTDVMRWMNERITVEETTTRDQLETQMHERTQHLRESHADMDLLVSWTTVGDGPLMGELRRGGLAEELLETLRTGYGFGPPAAWTVSISVEPTAVLPSEWYEQETIRGDFLREVRHLQINPSEPLDLESCLNDEHAPPTLRKAVGVSDQATRERILREAATLGVDLLSGEESES
ncbi:MAG: metallophosphoesterase family protein [Planctomycetota bacterium]|jgi:DNA repair exonuclease SbcCD nuclease subunit